MTISTYKRNPTVNANGPIYGPNEVSSDFISVLDPTKFEATELMIPWLIQRCHTKVRKNSRAILRPSFSRWQEADGRPASGADRAAIGSTLFRSPGNSNPVQ